MDYPTDPTIYPSGIPIVFANDLARGWRSGESPTMYAPGKQFQPLAQRTDYLLRRIDELDQQIRNLSGSGSGSTDLENRLNNLESQLQQIKSSVESLQSGSGGTSGGETNGSSTGNPMLDKLSRFDVTRIHPEAVLGFTNESGLGAEIRQWSIQELAARLSSSPLDLFSASIVILQETSPQGESSGAGRTGWFRRNMNKEIFLGKKVHTLEDRGVFSLDPGAYLLDANVPAMSVGAHQARLKCNLLSEAFYGLSVQTSNETRTSESDITTVSRVVAPVFLTQPSTWEVQQKVEIKRDSGGGTAVHQQVGEDNTTPTEPEIYTQVVIYRLGNLYKPE